jgi:hypothetical protein
VTSATVNVWIPLGDQPRSVRRRSRRISLACARDSSAAALASSAWAACRALKSRIAPGERISAPTAMTILDKPAT